MVAVIADHITNFHHRQMLMVRLDETHMKTCAQINPTTLRHYVIDNPVMKRNAASRSSNRSDPQTIKNERTGYEHLCTSSGFEQYRHHVVVRFVARYLFRSNTRRRQLPEVVLGHQGVA